MKIARETWLLGLICTIDMLLTAWLLGRGVAREANPVMRFYVDMGLPTFVAVKTLLYFAPLFVLELIRPRRPRFILALLRVGIAAYLIVYGIGVLGVNTSAMGVAAQEPHVSSFAR